MNRSVKPDLLYCCNIGSGEHPHWIEAHWIKGADIARFHLMRNTDGEEVVVHDSNIVPASEFLKKHSK